jgi:hypothetical protein
MPDLAIHKWLMIMYDEDERYIETVLKRVF